MSVTIVMVTYNRPGYVKRQLRFFQMLGLRHSLLILDGSGPDAQKANAETIRGVEGLQIIHKQFPHEMNQTLRIKEGMRSVHTPYAVIIADDDFLLPSAIEPCLQFLEKHTDYSSCSGTAPCLFVRHIPLGVSLLAMLQFLGNDYSNSYSDVAKRLIAHDVATEMGQPPLYYSLKRTSVVREAFEFGSQTTQYGAMERVYNSLTLLRGKHKVLNVPFSLRDYSSQAIIDIHRDATANEGRYISLDNEKRIREYFRGKDVDERLMDFIMPSTLLSDPDNIRPLETMLPTLYKAKKIQYFINFFTGKYIAARFSIPDLEVKALRSVI